MTYTEAVAGGMYVPARARATSTSPRSSPRWRTAGTPGWYVLEQDTILAGPPDDDRRDPVADVRARIAHILALADPGRGDRD